MREGLEHDVGALVFQLDELRRDIQNLEDCIRDNVSLPQVKVAFEMAAKHASRAVGVAGGAADRIGEHLNRFARVA